MCDVVHRGNTALALLLLVATNIIAVFTTPFLVQAALATRGGASGHVSLQPASLLINLVVTILAPAVVGKVCAPNNYLSHPRAALVVYWLTWVWLAHSL